MSWVPLPDQRVKITKANGSCEAVVLDTQKDINTGRITLTLVLYKPPVKGVLDKARELLGRDRIALVSAVSLEDYQEVLKVLKEVVQERVLAATGSRGRAAKLYKELVKEFPKDQLRERLLGIDEE